MIAVPIDGFYPVQKEYEEVQHDIRDDFIPSNINKQVVEEVVRDMVEEKKILDQRSHKLEEEI